MGGVGRYTMFLDPQVMRSSETVGSTAFVVGGSLGYALTESAGIHLGVRDYIFTGYDRDALNPVADPHIDATWPEFLEGVPEIARYDVIRVGENVKEQFEHDLALETKGVNAYNAGVALCAKVNDNGTRELMERILIESEEHVDWLETQLSLMNDVGLQNYLTEQMYGDADEG